ncbi:DUF2157 domain-containing protein [Paenibacillus sp. y28]|uniref:DUF2157 domain-containing protein n=1 Tax=Paenibacillus sp. y28 TaxID=3129110 RepID=UPI00301756C2
MSRKWLERESAHWVQKGIVSEEQVRNIMELYPVERHAGRILPVLGALLVGLGVLSFVAANWQGIHPFARLAILLVTLTGFYTAGERFVKQGNEKLGIALAGAGLLTFGGSLFLIAQMFHLTSNNIASFVLWGAFGTALTWLYRSRFIFILTAAILVISQFYSLNEFHTFSYVSAALLLAGLGSYWWRYCSGLLSLVLGAAVLIECAGFISHWDGEPIWFIVPLMVLYTAGDWLRQKERDAVYPLQALVLAVAYLMALFGAAIDELSIYSRPWADAPVFIPILLVLAALSAWGKQRRKRLGSLPEWLILLPAFLLPMGSSGVTYLLLMFLFSLYVLTAGFKAQWRFKINLGTLLFLATTLVAYTKLTWGFMDKSMFFLIGGLLLLGISWYLNKQKREALKPEGGNPDELNDRSKK